MKKNIKITTTLILAALVTFLFTSCFDPIYNIVRTDVKPEKPTVSGAVNSIARFKTNGKEYLVLAANGGLRYKDADNQSHGSWKKYKKLPFDLPHSEKWTGDSAGEYIAKVVSDQNNLYLVTVTFSKGHPDDFYIWASSMPNGWDSPKESWKEISNGIIDNKFNVFYTNDVKPENRIAYLRVDGNSESEDEAKKKDRYFQLSSASLVPATLTATDDKTKPVNSVVFANGAPIFFNATASISNGKMIYYGIGEDLMYMPVTGSTGTKALSVDAPIASLATTADSIIIGCGGANKAGGIKRTSLDKDGKPKSSLEDFSNNATFQLISSYQVLCLLNATPNETEVNSKLYATAMFPGVPAGTSKNEDKGLWSYYPNRGNWNRE